MQAFINKGRMSDYARHYAGPIVTTRAALLGAALYGLDQMRLKTKQQQQPWP